jgi:hypothetical protein
MTEEQVIDKIEELRSLDANDRCDRCGSQAYVLVVGMAGELTFCAHDFNKIEKSPEAYHKLQSFSYAISDQRDKLSDKRAGL